MSDENPNQSNNFKIINVSCSLSNIAIDTTLALSAFFSTGTSWYQPEKKCSNLPMMPRNLSKSNTIENNEFNFYDCCYASNCRDAGAKIIYLFSNPVIEGHILQPCVVR